MRKETKDNFKDNFKDKSKGRMKKCLFGVVLFAFGAAVLSGCGEKKPAIVEEGEMGKKLIDQANSAVEQAQDLSPDNLLDNIGGY